MIASINSFLVILLYGSLVVLSIILIANPLNVNKKANLFLGISLFMWSSFWIEEILNLLGVYLINPNFLFGLQFIQFFTPPLLFVSISFYTDPNWKPKKIYAIYFMLPLIYLMCLILRRMTMNSIMDIIIPVLINIQTIGVIVLCFIKLKRHKRKIQLMASNIHEKDLRWIEQIIFALLSMVIFIALYDLFFPVNDLNLFANSFTLSIVIFIAYHAFKQKEIYNIDENERQLVFDQSNTINIEKKKVISDKEMIKHKAELIRLMETEQPYLDEELSLLKLAHKLQISPHQLSYLINEGFGENFFFFINKYRVEKVKELLLREDKKHLSVLGIAYESGFNSKTSFNTTFRKISGITPSEFRKSRTEL